MSLLVQQNAPVRRLSRDEIKCYHTIRYQTNGAVGDWGGVGFVNLHASHKSRREATASVNRNKQCLATRYCRDKIAWFSFLAPYLAYPGRMQGIKRTAALNLAVRENMIFI
jgi:hypothetical protein